MKRQSLFALLVLVASMTLFAAACDDDGGGNDNDTSTGDTSTGDTAEDTAEDTTGDTTEETSEDTTEETSEDTTDTTGDTTPDEDMVVMTLCDEYCATVGANCTGSNAQYASPEECLTTCAGLTEGTEGDTADDTVHCRLYHADAPASADPTFHCPHAGPDGGGVCVAAPPTPCDRFCGNVLEACADDFAIYADNAECQAACAAFPTTGNFGDDSGDTVQCRDRHAQLALTDPTLCLATAASGGGVCIDDTDTRQIDRMARPAINTALVAAGHKDLFNFATPADGAFFIPDMVALLGVIDGLDGAAGNALGAAVGGDANLAALLAEDVLLYDLTATDCTDGYLALELAVPDNCGGRTLDQDIIDLTLQALVQFPAVDVFVSDDVDANDVANSENFPFLAAPHN